MPVSFAAALDDRAARRRFAAHEHRDTHDAVIADDRDLGGCAIRHDVQQRDDRVRGKVGVLHPAAGLVEDLPECHRRELEMGRDALVIGLRQDGEKEIVSRGRARSAWRACRKEKPSGFRPRIQWRAVDVSVNITPAISGCVRFRTYVWRPPYARQVPVGAGFHFPNRGHFQAGIAATAICAVSNRREYSRRGIYARGASTSS